MLIVHIEIKKEIHSFVTKTVTFVFSIASIIRRRHTKTLLNESEFLYLIIIIKK